MNDACCTRAPPLTPTAQPTGTYITLPNGMKCYKVGPPTSPRAIVFGYDALGYTTPQLLGADLLASKLSAQVFVPDFFRGEALDPSVFSLPAEERTPIVTKFITGPGNLETGVENAKSVARELKGMFPEIKSLAWQGFCWGGKVGIVCSGADTPFVVTAACHPGRLDVKDVEVLSVPHVCLLSGEDGSEEEAERYAAALRGSGRDVVYERFRGSVHGWMSARADFGDEEAAKEFERGYEIVARFFEKYV